ncbi:hypothetical protein ACFW04_013975 [Cataglyphis niger]
MLFDNVILAILISDLEVLGSPPRLCHFIYNLIHYRRLQFVINGELTDEYFSYKGVPQSSILSAILFNIYVAKFHKYIGRIFLSRKRFTVSPSKSSLVTFIKNTFTLPYSFIHSIKNMGDGASRSLLNIYKSLIKSSIEYGCFVFSFNNYTLMNTLEKIQFRAIRLCLGLRRTIPTNVLLTEAGESPLQFRFNLLLSKYILKIFSLDSYLLINKLFSFLWYSRKTHKINPFEKFLLFRFFCDLLQKKSYIAKFDYPVLDDENIPDSYVGFSIYSPFSHLQFLFKTHLFSSIFTAEALVILHTLEYILTNSISKSVIFIDSKSVIEALLFINLIYSINHIIFAIKQKLYEIKSVEFENSIISPKFFPHSDFYSISRKKYNDDIDKVLKNQGNQIKIKVRSSKGIKYFSSFEMITFKPIRFYKKRQSLSTITIYALNHSLYRCNLVPDPSCSYGSSRQDADHIFWSCPHKENCF